MELERRHFTADEFRVDEDADGAPQLVGYAAVFDSLSADLGGFRERIERGAFSDSLSGDIRALWNHNADIVLGRTASGTMRLSEDARGLRVEIDPPASGFERELEMIRRGDVNQMSFAFQVRANGDYWKEDENGEVLRTLTDVELFEVSPVSFPAYESTTIAQRAFESWCKTQQPPRITPAGMARIRMRKRWLDRYLTQ